MRLRTSVAVLLLWISTGCMGTYSQTEVGVAANATSYSNSGSVSVSYFYDRLEPYGYWAEYPQYGWCWVPRVGSSWRPYTDGRWAYTEYGWTWVSYEPFGWATFHYGRWWHDPYVGYVWVPGEIWAPAWVAWQYGDGYCGWAALPPESHWSASVGITSAPMIPALSWCFVAESRMLDRNVGSRLEPADVNVRILHRTRHATRYEVANGRPVNRGVDVEVIQRGAGRRIERERVVATRNPGRGRGPTAGPIEVFQPELEPARRGEAPPRARERSRTPAESHGVAQRAEAERRRLERALEEERGQLERRHAAEMRDPAALPRRQEVQRRHEEERRKFQEFSERQRKDFEQRAQVRRKQPPAERDQEKEQRNERSRPRSRGNGGGN